MKALITGGAGFIGAHVAQACLNNNTEVIILDDLSGGFENNIPDGALFVAGSITDRDLIDKLFDEHKFDYVYHLAAYAAEGLSHFIRHYNYSNNVLGSINLINASVNADTVKRFVFTSSIAVYGGAPPPMTEDTTPKPEDPYGIAKYTVEMDLAVAHEMFGLEYTIFRPHNVYGEKQNIGDRYRNVVGIFMNQIMQNQQLTIFGDGTQTRAFSYIGDIAPLIAQSVTMDSTVNEIYNIGADKPYSVLELAEVVGEMFGVSPDINFLPARNEVVHAYSSHSKAQATFGNYDITTLPDGIGKMAQWAKQQGARRSTLFEGVEIHKNMPPSWKKELLDTQ